MLSKSSYWRRYFYPRPPRGGRPLALDLGAQVVEISIHALREEGDAPTYAGRQRWLISIHALREEGDMIPTVKFQAFPAFLSTPSARRATRCRRWISGITSYFYPRPPRGGRHYKDVRGGVFHYFYPRPPRGGRRRIPNRVLCKPVFLSTPSARRATGCQPECHTAGTISIHALREEGDGAAGTLFQRGHDFYPRPPRGGRLFANMPA